MRDSWRRGTPAVGRDSALMQAQHGATVEVPPHRPAEWERAVAFHTLDMLFSGLCLIKVGVLYSLAVLLHGGVRSVCHLLESLQPSSV